MPARTAPRAVGALLSAALIGCAYVGCYAPTQIELRISSDAPCDVVAAAGAEISVLGSTEQVGDDRPAATAASCVGPADFGTGSSLGSLVLVPSDGRDERVIVEVVLRLPQRALPCHPPDDVDGCIVARRSIRFIPHTSLRVPIALSLACAGVPCGVDQTCDQGRCVVSDVGDCSGDCAPGGGGAPPIEDDAASDASETSSDAPHDAVTPPSRDAGDSGDSGVCPTIVPLKCPDDCDAGERCCIIENHGVACGDACVLAGSDQVCTDDCQCGPSGCSVAAGCQFQRFCGGTCAGVQ